MIDTWFARPAAKLGNTIRHISFMTVLSAISFFFISSVASAANKNNLPDSVLAVVNQDLICTSDFDRIFISLHNTQSASLKGTFDYHKLLDKLVNDRLLAQEALVLGLDTDKRLLDPLHQDRIQNAIREFFRDNFKPDLNISQEAVAEYFNANYYKMRLRTISLADSASAVGILDKLRSGADMDGLAREVSLDMYRYRGGLQNLKYYADIEIELRDRAARLAPGEIDGPVSFRTGFAILRLEDRVPADTVDFEKYKIIIESVLKQLKIESASAIFMDSLLGVYPISENKKVTASISADSLRIFTQYFTAGTEEIAFYYDDVYSMPDKKVRNIISRMAMTAAETPPGLLISNGLKKAKEDLVIETAALSGGYFDNPAVLDNYKHSIDSGLVELYLQETILPEIIFKRAEFEAYYNEHIEEFRDPREYRLEELIIPDETTALEVERSLSEGADFDFLVKRYNLEILTGGDTPRWVTMAPYPEKIKEEIETLKIGKTTRAFFTGESWLILRVRDSRPGKIKSIDEADMQIRQAMFQIKFKELLDKTLKILKENSSVILNSEGIEKYLGGKQK